MLILPDYASPPGAASRRVKVSLVTAMVTERFRVVAQGQAGFCGDLRPFADSSEKAA